MSEERAENVKERKRTKSPRKGDKQALSRKDIEKRQTSARYRK